MPRRVQVHPAMPVWPAPNAMQFYLLQDLHATKEGIYIYYMKKKNNKKEGKKKRNLLVPYTPYIPVVHHTTYTYIHYIPVTA